MSLMEEYHIEEDLVKERIRHKSPNHPILKKYFGSTYKAVEEYWKVEKELNNLNEVSVNSLQAKPLCILDTRL